MYNNCEYEKINVESIVDRLNAISSIDEEIAAYSGEELECSICGDMDGAAMFFAMCNKLSLKRDGLYSSLPKWARELV